MASVIPFDYRRKIVRDHQAGKTLREIASDLGYSYSAVRKIWRLFKSGGEAQLIPALDKCGRKSPYSAIKELIASEKNGQQGAPYIRSVLQEKYPQQALPHERTIQRWWRLAGENRPRGRRPKQDHKWTDIAHDTWQIDGKELVPLSTGEKVCWETIADEGTSTLLQSSVFPPLGAVQDE